MDVYCKVGTIVNYVNINIDTISNTSVFVYSFTGTPIQNSLKDLWMLLAFLHLKPFDVREWWNRVIQRPVTHGDKDGLQ